MPDHTARTFVEQVDVVCGVGYARAAAAGAGATRFHDIRRVVSNLGVFDFETPERTMRLRSAHPGVAVDEVVAATGFELTIPDDVAETRLPTPEELELIRDRARPRFTARPRGADLSAPAGAAPPAPRAAHRVLRPGRRALPARADRHGLGGRPPPGGRDLRGGRRSGILASATMTLDELAAAMAEVRSAHAGSVRREPAHRRGGRRRRGST